jgi:XTP/dITP diphosphohydrolase
MDSKETLMALEELINVVAKLRSPDGGCPWDLAQTPETLTQYLIEEAYEVVDAIQGGDKKAICEELGDLLLQVVLQSQIASENRDFSLKNVVEGITEKMIRRHPHVFGDVAVASMDDVNKNWEEIKASEKGQVIPDQHKLSAKLSSYPKKLPPLMAGMKISEKAAAAGFEWENVDGVWEKFYEEVEEWKQAIASESKENQEAELGDVLFTLLQLARWNNLNPSAALQSTNKKFIQRLQTIEALAQRSLSDCTIEELEILWQKAKIELAAKKGFTDAGENTEESL